MLAKRHPDIFQDITLLCTNPCFVKNDSNFTGMEQKIFRNFYISIQENYSKTIDKFLKLQLLGLPKDKLKIYYSIIKNIFISNQEPCVNTLLLNLDILNLDLRQELINLDNKITYILSDNDYLVPYELVEYIEIIKKPQDKVYTIPKATHLPHITNIENFTEILHMI